jgi:hypothetical protein
MNRNLAGRCGMYCGACEIRRAYEDAGKLRVEVAQRFSCLPAEVRCNGCRAVHIVGWARDPEWGRNCRILHCLKTQKLETCADCAQHSECDRWRTLSEECEKRGIDLKENLRQMTGPGIDDWLKAQDERWRCQNCGQRVVASFEDPKCHHCGAFQL